MPEDKPESASVDRQRVERHLRNVRLKLMAARRERQTLMRQSGLRRDGKGRVEIERAERHVKELEETEAELVKQLEPETQESAAESESVGQDVDKGASA